mgnify:CR=1 FL=1
MPRGKLLNGLVTQQKVLRAAVALFLEKGYTRTTTGEIAKAAGIGQSSFFHVFPSKEALLLELVKKAASVLGDSYDIEIVERHHRRKVDAPSGTALMIADAAAGACGHETEYVFERHSVRHPRDKKEIGISAVRGGTIVGEHEIIFAGHDEIMEIRHTALSREIFAQGAVEAAKFMATVKTPGLYDMSQLVK